MVDVKERVCVTGGGGYLASWLIKLLLSKGYSVHATVRDPENQKNEHLRTLENASENLQLFKAELLDYDSLYTAIKGCKGVFHVANPVLRNDVPNPEVEILEASVTGTSNILKACSIENVRRVVVVSSISAVIFTPFWPKGKPMDESCWSDHETCKIVEPEHMFNWYHLAKTIAESEALEYGKKTGLSIVTVCPSGIAGPMLQPGKDGSSFLIYVLLTDEYKTLKNKIHMIVDVRDVAEALLLVYEKPRAEGRYICSSYNITTKDLADKLKIMYPSYTREKILIEVDDNQSLTSEKLEKLGWRYRPLEETIVDSVQNFQERGMLA